MKYVDMCGFDSIFVDICIFVEIDDYFWLFVLLLEKLVVEGCNFDSLN